MLKEINGYTWPDRKQIDDFKDLKDDGTTACGCWIYTGVFPKKDQNQARSRKPDRPDGPGTHLGWGFAWPANRRIMYNRASADPDGKPWSERKKLHVVGSGDSASGPATTMPDSRSKKAARLQAGLVDSDHKGMDALDGRSPFIMIADGKSSLFVPSGLKDGPLPTHYEPVESPVQQPAVRAAGQSRRQEMGARRTIRITQSAIRAIPYVLTTYRLTEHHSGGIPTRSVPSTAELQPEGFRGDPAGARGRPRHRKPRLGRALHRARRDRERKRAGHRAPAAARDRRPPHPPDRHAVAFRLGRLRDRRHRQRALRVVGDPNTTIHEGKALTCTCARDASTAADRRWTRGTREAYMSAPCIQRQCRHEPRSSAT